VLPAATYAQQADRPAVKAGDQWQFVVYYGIPSAKPNRVWVITSVTPSGIEGTENGEPLLLTPELNTVESPLLKVSGLKHLEFPLRVGKRWRFSSDAVFKDNKSTAHSIVEVEVVAHEKVRVVAGEYDAFKLTAKSRFHGLSKGGPGVVSGESSMTYWYAPAVRAIVKSVSQNPYRGTSTVELVQASLQP
jgi:hypothetical protein